MRLHEELGAILAHELLVDHGSGQQVLDSAITQSEELLEVALGSDDEDELGAVVLREVLASQLDRIELVVDRLKNH